MAKNPIETCGFQPNTGVYYITGEYPCENYDTGVIKCLFQPRPDSDDIWANLSVFPMAQLNKPTTEIFHTAAEVKAAIAAKREERRNLYRDNVGKTAQDLLYFMMNHDCVTGTDPIARSVAIEAMQTLGFDVEEFI